MTLYGIGLGPGDADLVTVRGKRVLESAAEVYSPGRLSRTVATGHVPEERIADLDFPMTRDPEKLRRAWKEAAATIAPRAREDDVAFVTLGDPNVYSTFGHLRRTMETFHPDVKREIVPGVSAVTAFTTALGVEDAEATHEKLDAAGYDVLYGRRLYMEQGETLVTDDPEEIAERDYYTLAYAERRGLEKDRPTAEFTPGTERTERAEAAEHGDPVIGDD